MSRFRGFRIHKTALRPNGAHRSLCRANGGTVTKMHWKNVTCQRCKAIREKREQEKAREAVDSGA